MYSAYRCSGLQVPHQREMTSDVVLAFSGLEPIVPLGVELEVLFLVDAGTLLGLSVPAVVDVDVITLIVRVGHLLYKCKCTWITICQSLQLHALHANY